MNITTLQQSALLEAFNRAVARAAVSLARLMNESIRLSVPQIELLPIKEATHRLVEISDGRVDTVTQYFEGDLDALALLLFPHSRAFEIVRLAVGGLVSDDDLAELEQEAIAEMGNIVLNACMSMLSSQLRLELKAAPPTYLLTTPAQILSCHAESDHNVVLMIYIALNIKNHNISASIALLLDARGKTKLLDAIGCFSYELPQAA